MAEHNAAIQCHYDVLSVVQTADAATIKKAHRKMALQFHPDKNPGDESAADRFRLVQQAYECLSDPAERKWYDQHRDAILKGWSASSGNDGNVSILFDVVPFQYAGCYDGYGNGDGDFFAVYRDVFQHVYEGEEQGWTSEGNIEEMPLAFLSRDFGNGDSKWEQVSEFYTTWESFTSCLSFAWADVYDTKEAPNRRVRRAMEDENKRARRNARKERNEDVLALVHFCKRRDPRVKAQRDLLEQKRLHQQASQQEETKRKKEQAAEARKAWQVYAEQSTAELEEEDRMAGRVRLADLDDDYDYGGSKRGKKGKKKNRKQSSDEEDEAQELELHGEHAEENEVPTSSPITDDASGKAGTDNEDLDVVETKENAASDDEPSEHDELRSELDDVFSEEETDSEPEPEIWRCECCRKDFKSDGQMANHMNSKKHKEAHKKFQAKKTKQEEAEMNNLIDKLALDP